jgi:benzylsuccinate CoA-transferase BbsF subunit
VVAPLEGIRVLDLSWVMVGPAAGRYLGDLGAEIIKVESATRIDPLRFLPPFQDGQPGLERSVSYQNLNSGKRCITLDLKHERGREVVLRLVGWADVLIESFTPRVLRELGLDWDRLQATNERLIMASASIAGRTGPFAASTKGLGTTGAALAGATALVGWPDRPPVGPFGPWTDAVAPRYLVASILAALHHRRSSGRGIHIDLSQVEAGLQFLAPALLQYTVNGENPQRRGSHSAQRVPCGLYPSTGKDRWVAIEASRADDWSALRGLIGGVLLESRFDTLIGRLRARREIDDAVSSWTTEREAREAEALLQRAGVPAHVVCRAGDLERDPELEAAGYLRRYEDEELGKTAIEGIRFGLVTEGREALRGPRLGEHTEEILTSVCGYSPEEVAELRASQAL